MSAQDLKISWGPHPTAPVPLAQVPQLLPEKIQILINLIFVISKRSTGFIVPSQNAMVADEVIRQNERVVEVFLFFGHRHIVAPVFEA